MKEMYGYEIIQEGKSFGYVSLYTNKKKSMELMKRQGLDPKRCIEVQYPVFEKRDNPVY